MYRLITTTMAFTDFDETKITDDSAATLSHRGVELLQRPPSKAVEMYSKQADDMTERGYKTDIHFHYVIDHGTVSHLLQTVIRRIYSSHGYTGYIYNSVYHTDVPGHSTAYLLSARQVTRRTATKPLCSGFF